MPLPVPTLGLVVHYGFVWAVGGSRKPPDAGKDRPCVIVDVEQTELPGQRPVIRVTYLPISHVPPRRNETAAAIPPRVAAHLGLTVEASFLYTSYAVEDDWPFDLAHVPGSGGRFHYGFLPPRLFASAVAEFTAFRQSNPGFTYRR